ncbi:hypothetical protein Lal_00021734 [Lupinus albus]|uniref:Uncharacterized protein n=1 Tax=Lupinus albus TaxID=3870 RepID=A0A6A4N1Q4_LUPAL|nr:hypothetical protein Lalb_Chr25g0279401 [Lupinus albus]KAF1865734.1 hypothetical protein Lal_00021734 [Lupinus albus]
MTSSISNGIVLTTAMVVSTTVLYFAFSRQKTHLPSFQISNKQILRSCLYSEEKRRGRKKNKRVKFAENVMMKEGRESIKKVKKEEKNEKRESLSRNGSMEMNGMPENRVALYKGMLRDRGHKIAFFH